jgi:hypothetical protein
MGRVSVHGESRSALGADGACPKVALFVALLAVACGSVVVSETCGAGLDIKLQMVEVGANTIRSQLYYLQDGSGSPDNHVLVVTDAGDL